MAAMYGASVPQNGCNWLNQEIHSEDVGKHAPNNKFWNPDSEIGTEPDEYYGKLWHYVRISLVHNSDGRPILSANMHWSQEDKKLPKRVLLALAGDPKVEGSGLAESADLEMRKRCW